MDAIETPEKCMSHPFIPAPNCALVEMVYTNASQIIENTFHIQGNVPFTSATLNGLAVNVFDGWDNASVNGWKGLRGGRTFLQQIKCRALDTNSSPVFIYVIPVPRQGTNPGTTDFPPNASFAITLQTGLAGRSYRGRLYMPSLTNNQVQASPSQGLVQTAYANLAVASLQQLIVIMNAYNATWKHVVLSYRNGGAWRATAVATPIISYAYADLAIDSQRRRLPGRGR